MKTEQDLIARAILDAEFRGRLLKEPEAVIDAEGYQVSPQTRERIKSVATMTPQAIESAVISAAREGSVGG